MCCGGYVVMYVIIFVSAYLFLLVYDRLGEVEWVCLSEVLICHLYDRFLILVRCLPTCKIMHAA